MADAKQCSTSPAVDGDASDRRFTSLNKRRHHRQMLLIAALVTTLSFLLVALPDGRVAFRGWTQWPLPELCMSRSMFHVPCPGCGLTRSFIHLAQGDVNRSLAVNRVGWLIALAVLIQFPYRLYSLYSPSARRLTESLVPIYFGRLLIVVLVFSWIGEQIVGRA